MIKIIFWVIIYTLWIWSLWIITYIIIILILSLLLHQQRNVCHILLKMPNNKKIMLKTKSSTSAHNPSLVSSPRCSFCFPSGTSLFSSHWWIINNPSTLQLLILLIKFFIVFLYYDTNTILTQFLLIDYHYNHQYFQWFPI